MLLCNASLPAKQVHRGHIAAAQPSAGMHKAILHFAHSSSKIRVQHVSAAERTEQAYKLMQYSTLQEWLSSRLVLAYCR